MNRIMIIATVVFFISGTTAQATENELSPVSFLKTIHLNGKVVEGNISAEKIDAFRDSKVETGAIPPVGIELTDQGGNGTQKRTVTTCREYQELKDENWAGASRREKGMENYFKKTCGLVNVLATASPSERTNFDDPAVSLNQANLYPADFLSKVISLGDESECGNARLFRECANALHGTIEMKDGNIVYSDEDNDVIFRPLLRGDVDHDGFEDIVFTYSHGLKKGSFHASSYLCLGQAQKGYFSLIDCK